MKIRTKVILVFLVVALLIGVGGCFSLSQLNKIADLLNKDIPESMKAISETSYLDELAHFIRYYDEVLTQSVRNYAFTQDKKWEKRYRNVEPKLDKVIKEAIKKGDQKDKEFFSRVYSANLALVDMQYRAIEYVNNGQPEEAIKLLESQRYWDQKNIYEQGLRSYVARRGSKYDEAFKFSTEILSLTTKNAQNLVEESTVIISILFVIALMLTAIIGFFASRSISNPIRELTDVVGGISMGKLDVEIDAKLKEPKDEIGRLATAFDEMKIKLKESYESLEEKVKEKTEKLEKALKETEEEKAKVEQRTAELERVNKLMIGRELRMVELKKEIEKLEKKKQ